MAPNLESLIFFRVLQGLCAGPLIPLSQSLLLSSYPRAKSGMALAMWSMTTLVAPVAGPLLGGWISDDYSWPWIFLHQHSGRHHCNLRDLDNLPHPRNGYAQAPDRRHRPRIARGVDRCAADHARQGQGTRLVCEHPDHDSGRRSRGRFRRVPDLGTDRRAPGGGPPALCGTQFHDGNADHVGRVWRVLRQSRAAAAVAADANGLYGHQRGFRPRAGRISRDTSLANDRTLAGQA